MNEPDRVDRARAGLAQGREFGQAGLASQYGQPLSQSLGERESLKGEISAGIRPVSGRQPADTAGERAEGFDAVLVAVLGVDRLAGTEVYGFAGNAHLLASAAGEVHFDAMLLAIVEGVMVEHVEPEISVQLAVDARQQVEVEFRRHASSVVVGGVEDLDRLDQVDTDDECRAVAEDIGGIAEKRRRFMGLKISDG